MDMKNCEFWFVVGSQFLYGPEVLETVAQRAAEMADTLNKSGNLPCKVVYKATVKTDAEITQVMKDANYDENCYGVITWCHTFSPSKMWIHGFGLLQKPYCHLATQYNRKIPNEEIDMDFMNLNQAAHGDREHGFIGARMRLPRKVIAGYWQDKPVQDELAAWMRAAVGYAFSHKLRIVRFGDNMRDVAVTEGDKVETQIKLGWQVDYWPVGHLVETMDAVTEAEIDGRPWTPSPRRRSTGRWRSTRTATTSPPTIWTPCAIRPRKRWPCGRSWSGRGPRPSSTTSRTCTAWSSSPAWPANEADGPGPGGRHPVHGGLHL